MASGLADIFAPELSSVHVSSAGGVDSVSAVPGYVSKSGLESLLDENPRLRTILDLNQVDAARRAVYDWAFSLLSEPARAYYLRQQSGRDLLQQLSWREFAAIRMLDYVDNSGREFVDTNQGGEVFANDPIGLMWQALHHGDTQLHADFWLDMIELFRQLDGRAPRRHYHREEQIAWMQRHPSGLDKDIISLRAQNRLRIIRVLIDKMDAGEIDKRAYRFAADLSREQKVQQMLAWWQEKSFHLQFAVRDPDLLNELLDSSLSDETMRVLYQAQERGIPFFVNPYYLSLLNVAKDDFASEDLRHADLAIRDYVLYSPELVQAFGRIEAWEKEDLVEPGKPNAAGWLLPNNHNIHRRYPDLAILIPDSMGRACGGLCASCQRMYDFQRGHLNFDLEQLKPQKRWPERLAELMDYFRQDAQLRDILITGGDALMSADKTLKSVLDAVLQMAQDKREDNKKRPEGQKYAEMRRVRLGTRLPAYLPQRITDELIDILKDFKKKASTVGLRQFVIQAHFQSPMEITPEARKAVAKLISAGWMVTNQHVYTAGASRRGHNAKLRTVLNDIGVVPYYTFSVKGFLENQRNFATNARAVQEQHEEKILGLLPNAFVERLRALPDQAEEMIERLAALRQDSEQVFIASDRSVFNLPGVGKSLTFRVIGLTSDGRRILEFDHDTTRAHSPIIQKMGRVAIVESKSLGAYLRQLAAMGESLADYENLFGYSISEIEPRMPIYEYPEFDFSVTSEMTNLQI